MPDPLCDFLLNLGRGTLDLLYPPHCASCGVRILCEIGGTASEIEMLCRECREMILPAPAHLCPVCSHPMEGMLMCPNCDGRRWCLSVIVAACRYEGLVRELVQRFKYGRDQSLARPLAGLLARALHDSRLHGKSFDSIVPVPLHPLREREREFNQSGLVASLLAKQSGIPMRNLLTRTRATPPQAGFDRIERMKNLEAAFSLRKRFPRDVSILLVDDVSTTGSTLDCCAALLMEEGAGEVCAVTVARG